MSEFEDAKVGDAVAIVRYYGWSRRLSAEFSVIEKVTATQITAFNGTRFMRSNGRRVGDANSWHPDVLRRDTPELRAEIAKSEAFYAAQRKCSEWAEKLKKARYEDAVRLAALLPDLTDGDK